MNGRGGGAKTGGARPGRRFTSGMDPAGGGIGIVDVATGKKLGRGFTLLSRLSVVMGLCITLVEVEKKLNVLMGPHFFFFPFFFFPS